jgi:hypothetical protein
MHVVDWICAWLSNPNSILKSHVHLWTNHNGLSKWNVIITLWKLCLKCWWNGNVIYPGTSLQKSDNWEMETWHDISRLHKSLHNVCTRVRRTLRIHRRRKRGVRLYYRKPDCLSYVWKVPRFLLVNTLITSVGTL